MWLAPVCSSLTFTPNQPPGEITLHAKGGVEAALGLLDVDKFRFLQKAGVETNIAQGVVVVDGTIDVAAGKRMQKWTR